MNKGTKMVDISGETLGIFIVLIVIANYLGHIAKALNALAGI